MSGSACGSLVKEAAKNNLKLWLPVFVYLYLAVLLGKRPRRPCLAASIEQNLYQILQYTMRRCGYLRVPARDFLVEDPLAFDLESKRSVKANLKSLHRGVAPRVALRVHVLRWYGNDVDVCNVCIRSAEDSVKVEYSVNAQCFWNGWQLRRQSLWVCDDIIIYWGAQGWTSYCKRTEKETLCEHR